MVGFDINGIESFRFYYKRVSLLHRTSVKFSSSGKWIHRRVLCVFDER
jgi:hypothetical protein